jgi:CPA2 family monovalent cation:H+ antiporter-2
MNEGYQLVGVGLTLLFLFVVAIVLRTVKVPYVVSFMVAGFLGRSIIPKQATEMLVVFQIAAVAVLFFFIGLEYSFEKLKTMTKVLVPGLIDLLVCFSPAFIMALLGGSDIVSALVISSILYPTSTAIVAKLLMDYKRLAYPEAPFMVGLLVFEDLVCIILISVLFPLGSGAESSFETVTKGIIGFALVFGLFFVSKQYSRIIFAWIDRVADEGIFIFLMLGLILLLSGIATNYGVSEALVAFLLGVLVPQNSKTMMAVQRSLSDLKELAVGVFFFLIVFQAEISLDMKIPTVVLLIALAILSKMVATFLGARWFGLSRRGAIRASFSFLPRGEFSLLFATVFASIKPVAFVVVLATTIVGGLFFAIAPKAGRILSQSPKK